MAVKAVYDGQRRASDRKRVFILSRSAYAGSQRYGVAVWSGDVNPDWVFLKKQIPAGLNFSLSGMPHWTTDIGGFLPGDPTDPAYRELFVRWFQFGTFCPIFRVHGTRAPDENELWSYGPESQKILVQYDRLRYHLLPYIYSLAWMTTHERYTPMRPLVMDFRTDARAATIGDQFMFGPALLVNPVTEPAADSRRIYLPKGRWFDFWEGKRVEGGKAIVAPAPIDRLPLYVRGGSIIPMGPDVEWSDQKPADPIELRIYPGSDGHFTLYEDQNDSYDYEKGAYATIRFDWDDATRTLSIGRRSGSFPGMEPGRTFRLVLVGRDQGVGASATPRPDRVVTYNGNELRVTLKTR